MKNSGLVLGWMARAAALLSAAMFLFGLGLFAYAGTFSRYWADDYCYSATIKQAGLLRGILDWLQTSGNRFTTLPVVAFSDLFGRQAIQWIPLAVLLVWIAAWIFCLSRLSRLIDLRTAGYWPVLLALIEVYFAALLAPDRLQTIYWRMGTFHYTLPIPLLLVTLGLMAGVYRCPGKRMLPTALLCAFLGFFAAGLSETFAALQTGLLALLILAAGLFTRGTQRKRALGLLAAPLAGSLLTMAIMASAPANAWRQAVMPPPANLLLILPYSLRYAGDFIFYTLRGQVIPFVVYMVVVGCLGLVVFSAEKRRISLRKTLAGIALSLAVMYLLIVCSFAPSAYAGLAYPAGRALMPACFILLTGLSAAALGAAAFVSQGRLLQRQAWPVIVALVLFAAFSLYPLRAASAPRQDVAQLAIRAVRWDARNAQILASIAAGKLNVQVKQVDVVHSLEDMGPDPTQWINACASVFYGVRSITASP